MTWRQSTEQKRERQRGQSEQERGGAGCLMKEEPLSLCRLLAMDKDTVARQWGVQPTALRVQTGKGFTALGCHDTAGVVPSPEPGDQPEATICFLESLAGW